MVDAGTKSLTRFKVLPLLALGLLASHASADFLDVTALVGLQRTVPKFFTKDGFLVGEYNWEYHESSSPNFALIGDQVMTTEDTILDVSAAGIVLIRKKSYPNDSVHYVWKNGVARPLGMAGYEMGTVYKVLDSGVIAGELYNRDWNYNVRRVALWDANQPEQPLYVSPWPSRLVLTGIMGDTPDTGENDEVHFNATVKVLGYERNRPFVWMDGKIFSLSAGVDLSAFPSRTPPNVYASRMRNSSGWVIVVRSAEQDKPIGQIAVRAAGKVETIVPPFFGKLPTPSYSSYPFSLVHNGGVVYFRNRWLMMWRKGVVVNLFRKAGLTQADSEGPFWFFANKYGVHFRHTGSTYTYKNNGTIRKWPPRKEYATLPYLSVFGHYLNPYLWRHDFLMEVDSHAAISLNGITNFLDFAGIQGSRVMSANSSNEAVGTYESDDGTKAFVYRRGRWRDLGIPAKVPGTDGPGLGPTVIDERGRIAINASFGNQEERTYIYTEELGSTPDSYSAISGQTLVIDTLHGVLPNDLGLGDLSAVLAEGPKHGTLALDEDGSFEYTPSGGYVGEDSFLYKATNGSETTEPTEVRIKVVAENSPPIASAPSVAVSPSWDWEDERLIATTIPIMASATDANDPQETLTYEWWKDGNLRYIGPKLVTSIVLGTERYTLIVRDPHGAESRVAVTIKVWDYVAPRFYELPERIDAFATTNSGTKVNYEFYAFDNYDDELEIDYSPPPGSFFSLGKSILSLWTKDFCDNEATAKIPIFVTFDCSGFQEPASGSTFKVGDAVTASFALKGVSAQVLDAKATLWVNRTDPDPAFQAGTFSYVTATGRYECLWNTAGFKPGTYTLRLDLGDGVAHRTQVVLVK